MRSFDKLANRLASALLAFALAPAKAVGEQFWQALRAPKDKNDRGWLPAIVRLVARLTALDGVIVVLIDVLLLSFPGLTRSPLLERIFTQFFDFSLPAWLAIVAGLICALSLLSVAVLTSAIGAYKGQFAAADGVDAVRHLIWWVVPSSVAIAILSTLLRNVVSVLEAAPLPLLAGVWRLRISELHARQPVMIRARTITHVCLSPRILAQRPNAARALRAATL